MSTINILNQRGEKLWETLGNLSHRSYISLRLNDCYVDSRSFSLISSYSSLSMLILKECEIETLEPLAVNTSISKLGLYDVRIDAGLNGLKGNTSIKVLGFDGNKDTFSTLPPLPLDTLILYNKDPDVDIEKLSRMTTLKALTANCVGTKDTIQSLLSLTFLERLRIPTIEGVDLKPLLINTNLQELAIYEYNSCQEQIEVLGQCSLTSLDLSKSNIGDAELATLSLNTNLISLNIEDTDVTAQGVSSIALHPNLTSLYLPIKLNIEEALANLEHNTTISTLEFNGCPSLTQMLPVLKYRVRNMKIRASKQRLTACLFTVLAHCFL